MVDFIVEFLSSTGYIGVFLLMALENIFPPIPSEMIMPFAGFVASKGELNVIAVTCATEKCAYNRGLFLKGTLWQRI